LVPAKDVTLSWATFNEAADQAGISRRHGGIHFLQGHLEARATAGRDGRVGEGADLLETGRLEPSLDLEEGGVVPATQAKWQHASTTSLLRSARSDRPARRGQLASKGESRR
jgi:hypothetical protein